MQIQSIMAQTRSVGVNVSCRPACLANGAVAVVVALAVKALAAVIAPAVVPDAGMPDEA